MSDKVDVRFMLFLDCNEQVCTERILERGKSSGRDDDNIDSIRKRHQTYESETKRTSEGRANEDSFFGLCSKSTEKRWPDAPPLPCFAYSHSGDLPEQGHVEED